MIWVYNILLLLLSPIWLGIMWLKNAKRKEKIDWAERFGDYKIPLSTDRKRIWIHAVSVGEVMAARPIVEKVRVLLPEYEIVCTVGTGSGYATAKEQYSDCADYVFFIPIDLMRMQFNALQRVLPAVVVFMESEHWPNFMAIASQMGIRKILVNGRVSDRTFQRCKWFGWFLRLAVSQHDRCLMQTETDAERIKSIGGKSVEVFGNSKFDEALPTDPNLASKWREILKIPCDKKVIVIGSTRGEEDERFVFKALLQSDLEGVVVVHAPRHLERVEAISASVVENFGNVALRSKGETGNYILLDTMGELGEVYSVADVVIVGGGFANLGGQNILQPLAHGKPVIHGQFMHNFRDIAAAAMASGATQVVETPEDLSTSLERLLNDDAERNERGMAAKSFVMANAGASDRYAQAIVDEVRKFESTLKK